MKTIIISLRLLAAATLLFGFIYPLVGTGAAFLFFPEKARGSLLRDNGRVIGSALIGERFTGDAYFHGRPSATNYRAMPSGASNLGPTSAALAAGVQERRERFAAANRIDAAAVPCEMLFASGSGLDPHISPRVARLQVDRVAAARGLSREDTALLRGIIRRLTEKPDLGVFGEERINVLRLNLETDRLGNHGER